MWRVQDGKDSDHEDSPDTFVRPPMRSMMLERETLQIGANRCSEATLSESDDSQTNDPGYIKHIEEGNPEEKPRAPWEYFLARTGVSLYRFLEVSDSSFAAKVWSWSIMGTILVSITCFLLQTHPSLYKYEDFWSGIEVFTTFVFLLEYLLRFSVCRVNGTIFGFLFNKLNICDLLAILPWFVDKVLQAFQDNTGTEATESSDTEVLRVFRAVRLVRVLRLLKLGRKSLGVRVLDRCLSDSAKAINILLLWITLSMILFSALLYYSEKFDCPSIFESLADFTKYNAFCNGDTSLRNEVVSTKCCIFKCDKKARAMFPNMCLYGLEYTETIYFWEKHPIVKEGNIFAEAMHSRQETFFSIPRASWWAMVTMTTVGYGDAAPESKLGSTVGTMTMLCGILTIALPVAIIGTKFNEHYHRLHAKDPTARKEKFARQSLLAAEAYKETILATVNDGGSLKDAIETTRRDSTRTSVVPLVSPVSLVEEPSIPKTLIPSLSRILRLTGEEKWEREVNVLRELIDENNAVNGEILATHLRFNRLMQELTGETAAMVKNYLIDNGIKEDPFCSKSLYLFSFDGKLRRWCCRVANNPGFDTAVFIIIILNTVIFIMQSPWRGPDYWAAIMEETVEVVFLVFFTIEMAIKVIARGFFVDKYSYLRDVWNWLDFTVIFTGWFQIIATSIFGDESGGFLFLRTFRVLRPLRSMSTLHGMRALVQTVMASMQQLSTVVTMLMFLLVIFGVLGMNFWGGLTHKRCRLTKWPLFFARERSMCKDNDWCFTPETPDFQFWCQQNPQSGEVNGISRRIPRDYDSQECYNRTMFGNDVYVMWPVDIQQTRLCGGFYQCQPPDANWYKNERVAGNIHLASLAEDKLENTFCGSSIALDFGSVQNLSRGINRVDNFHRENQIVPLNQGLSSFDNMGSAVVLIFQSITLEGWVDIMYMLTDTGSVFLPFLYFFLLILVGSFFLLNVTLAIVSTTFSEAQDADEKEVSDLHGTDKVETKSLESEDDDVFVLPPSPEKVSTIVRVARVISFSEAFQSFIMLVISANVVVMSLDRYPPPTQRQQEILSVINKGFLWTFIIECVLLNIALGMPKYWTKPMHIFDGLVVVVSVIGAITGDGSGGSATAIRSVRLLRVFKLAKKWTSFRMLLKSMFATVLQMGNFFFLLIIIILVFALAGQSFFQTLFLFDADSRPIEECQTYVKYSTVNAEYCQKVCPMGANGLPSCVPRSHFDTLWWAWMTVFQILSGENWNLVMYDGMTAGGRGYFLYFAAVVILGSFIILNLCLAILMSIFEEQTKHNRRLESDIRKLRQRKVRAIMIGGAVFSQLKADVETAKKLRAEKEESPTECIAGDDDNAEDTAARTAMHERTFKKLSNLSSKLLRAQPTLLINTSCMIFPHDGAVERIARKFVQHERFDQVILFGIIVSSCLMIFNSPTLDPTGDLRRALTVCDSVFTVIFTIEMVLKVISYNLLWNRPPMHHNLDETEEQKRLVDQNNKDFCVAYLRTGWNILDFTVVIVSWIDLLASEGDVSFLKTLRTLRALRPLRLISRNRNMKLVVNTIFQALPEFVNLLIVSALFFLIFSLFFVTLYLGGFYSCINKDFETMPFTNYTMNDELVGTPLCIDHGNHNFLTKVASKDECVGTNKTFHQRLSTRTPICVLHCKEGMDSGVCHENRIWGYNVMTCTHCQEMVAAEFEEPIKTQDDYDACARECETATNDEYFCAPLNSNYAKGQLSAADIPLRAECVTECTAQCLAGNEYCEGLRDESAWCVEQGNKWGLKIPQHFDDIGHGMLTLFEVATTEGWIDVMLASVDSKGPHREPSRDFSEMHAVYYFVFIFFGSFFLLNLFVGVTIDNFNRIRHERQQSSVFLTVAQERWVNSQRAFYSLQRFFPLTNLHLLPPKRRWFYFLVSSHTFENTIMVAIVLNTICMGCNMYPLPEGHEDTYRDSLIAINYIFAVIFNFEAGFKMYALRMAYFGERWNCFDFVCVASSNIGIFLEIVIELRIGSVVSAIRLFRVARLFRLVRFMKGLNELFTAFFLSLPKLVNVAAILFLSLFIFAVLGMNMFATILQTGAHNEHANFQTFPRAIVTLFRCMTGEGWNQLMHDLSKTPFDFKSMLEVNCMHMRLTTHEDWLVHYEKGELEFPVSCGQDSKAQIFFVLFNLLVAFLIFNLFIAVILEGFDEATKSDTAETIETCINKWKKYDPECTMMIHLNEACLFVEDVCGPLGSISQSDGTISFDNFDLQTARILRFKLSNDDQNLVTFFSAVLAVFRRKIVHADGTHREVAALLQEVESFERMGEGWKGHHSLDTDDFREITKNLQMLQKKQQKSLAKELGGKEAVDDDMVSFEAQVAAAKIQISWKNLIRHKRRPDIGQDPAARGSHFGHDPIARAAG